MPLGTNAPKLWPALPVNLRLDGVLGQAVRPHFFVISLPVMVPTTRWMLRMGRSAWTRSPRSMAGSQMFEQPRHVERLFEAVVLVNLPVAADFRPDFRLIKNVA